MPSIALVTARRAASQVREVAQRIAEKTGWRVDVYVAPVEVASLIPREILLDMLRRLRGYDIVVVPGGLSYDVVEAGREVGVRVVRGPDNLWDLELLGELGEDGLAKLAEAGRLSGELLLDRWLEELRRRHEEAEGVEVCGLRIPLRPPPIIVVAEVYVKPGMSPEEAASRARELAERGASLVVLGFGFGWDRGEALRVLRAAADAAGFVGVDTPDRGLAVEALGRHACLLLSIAPWNIGWLEELPRGAAVVATPVGEDMSIPSTPTGRVEVLRGVVERVESRGLTAIADPIVDPPGYGSLGASIASYFLASIELTTTPLMAGIANIYELMDADSHALIAGLTQVYGEAGASLMLVSEESWKARMAVTEAAIAATMTSISLLKKRPPKDIGVSLLYAKEKRPREGGPRPPRRPRLRLDARSLAAWTGFRRDLLGSHLILLEEDRIVDYYIGRRGTIRLEASSAEEAYKAAAYLGLASEPTHYAYLGYELCKAEYAARMRRSYVQEEPLVEPPWTKNVFYDPRSGRGRRLTRPETP